MEERMNICDMYKMQITHLLAGKVTARLSAVTVSSTIRALVAAVAAGNWVNGNPSLSLSVDDLSALTSNSTKSKSLALSSYIHNTCLPPRSCFYFSDRTI